MNKIKVGVIGVGHLGRHHARIYSELENCELFGVVDIDPKQREEIAALYNTRAFVDYRELIGQVDAVSVAVPTAMAEAPANIKSIASFPLTTPPHPIIGIVTTCAVS